jgi:biopolymer transport protein ExbD
MAIATRRDTRPVADINITPLIDVMLVLLIIFMVVVPVSRRALDAALPEPARPDSRGGPPAVVVVVDATGITLGTTPTLTVAALATALRDELIGRRDKTVFVRAGGGVPYARVVEVVDVVRGAGADRIGLVPEADGARPRAPGR